MTYRSSEEWEQFLGEQIRRNRLQKNTSQVEVAKRAGVSLRTLARLEAGQGSSLSSFVKVLTAMGKDSLLQSLSPTTEVSPIQMMQMKKRRQRATRQDVVRERGRRHEV